MEENKDINEEDKNTEDISYVRDRFISLISGKLEFFFKPTVLITGASGFIGGFLVEEALRQGYDVWAGVRSNSNRERLQDERIRFIELDYDDRKTLIAQLKKVAKSGGWDYIIHNAGITKTIDKNEFFRVNAEYTRNFIEALHAADCRPKKFVLMSSLSSFGGGSEKFLDPILSNDPQAPDTAYGQSKLGAERYIRSQTYFPYVILRPTGVYGPGERDYFIEIKSINAGFDFAAGLTPQHITFIYVKDLARVALLVLEKEHIQSKSYFVADGDVYTDTQFARLVKEVLGRKHVLRLRIPMKLVYVACVISEWIGKRFGKSMTLNTDKYMILKQRNWICDVAPLQKDLQFKAEYPLRKGLEETIAWYRKEKWI